MAGKAGWISPAADAKSDKADISSAIAKMKGGGGGKSPFGGGGNPFAKKSNRSDGNKAAIARKIAGGKK